MINVLVRGVVSNWFREGPPNLSQNCQTVIGQLLELLFRLNNHMRLNILCRDRCQANIEQFRGA
jgi:hypothetical protein